MSPLSPRTGEIIFKHVSLLICGLILGLFYGRPLTGLGLAALVGLIWHVFHLNGFLRWLRDPASARIPGGIGPWPTIYSHIQYERDNIRKLRARVQGRLRELRNVTNALPDAGFVLDDGFLIRQHNDSARRMFGMGNNNVTGLHITNIIRNPAFVEMIEAQRFSRPVHIVPASDTSRVFSCQMTNAAPGQRLLMVRDITERERENRIRADFVANASHELRTPLTVLLGYLHSMQEDSSVPTHWQEPMEEMASQVGRMQALVEDLLHLNQLESTVDAPTDPVPLRKLIKRVCKDAKRMAGERLNVDWECDEHVSLLGDRKVLRSVLTNLVSNAVRFTPRGGRVHIRWQVDERGGHIEVTDTGIGIAAEDFSRLTERFYRTDRGRARHDGGTGIGLAIVKHGLSIHQARLEIESEIDRGSTFRCVFPAARIIAQAGATLSAQTDEVNHG